MHEDRMVPAWTTALLESEQARLQGWLERISALARFRRTSVTPFDGGYAFGFEDSERFRTALAKFTPQHFFRVQGFELDDCGTFLLLSTSIQGRVHGALVAWNNLPSGAAHIRSRAREEESFFVLSQTILNALHVPQTPVNSIEAPGYSTMQWGTLLRLDRPTAEKATLYLCVEPPPEQPLLVNLAPQLSGIFAWSPIAGNESLRIALCHNWTVDIAQREIGRWLKTFSVHKKGGLPIT